MTRAFDFGLNWEQFSERRLEPESLLIAIRSLQTLLERDNLHGLSVLDIGCGSGLFAIAAHELGAAKVVGIDIDPRCIVVSEQNLKRLSTNASVAFRRASVLDQRDLALLGMFDLVYAWGSLHHTGAMWEAIGNAAKQISPQGTLVLAIYNKHTTSPLWKRIKWLYNHVPNLCQRIMTIFFAGLIYVAKFLATGRNPLRKERGMDFWHDVIDWVGGYPYEYATSSEVESFMKARGFALRRHVPAQVPTGCNEFVFERNIKLSQVDSTDKR